MPNSENRPDISTLLYPGALLPVGTAGVGEVRVEQILGVGTFAVVCRVTDTASGEPYALKVLRDVKVEDAETREISLVERIRREAAVFIPSWHVVRALGLSEWDERTFLILFEYFPGRPLHRLIEFGPEGLTDDERRVIFGQVLQGVADAHRANVIHRDLKPENILVGVTGAVKVIDFGLARFGDQRITVAESRFGTPQYMAPEVIEHGAGYADARADIYALGHILYELSMHRHFWQQKGWDLFAFYKHLMTRPAVAADLSDFHCPLFPEAGPAVVERMLRVRPEERYASVAEVMADLGYAEAEVPTRPRTPPGAPPTPRLRLRLLSESEPGAVPLAEVALEDGEQRTLGRADFAGDDPSVGVRHLEAWRVGDHLLARDAGSRNGTLVNGVRLSAQGWAALEDGDRLRLGDLFVSCSFTP
jgi:serine/threonine-protein kinase